MSSPLDLSAPYAVLPATDGRILAVLAGTTRPLGGREIGRLAGVPSSSTWRALRSLVEEGVVLEDEAGGNTIVYRLNREHLAADAVITLTRLRSLLVERIAEHLRGWEIQPVLATLFGSAARGDGSTASDIDLLVVRPKEIAEHDDRWGAQLGVLAEVIESWTGNRAGIADISEREIPRLRRERPPIVEGLEADGIALVGEDPRSFFRRRR